MTQTDELVEKLRAFAAIPWEHSPYNAMLVHEAADLLTSQASEIARLTDLVTLASKAIYARHESGGVIVDGTYAEMFFDALSERETT